MHALGCGVYPQLLAAYTLGGLFAGIAGALSAQVTNVVGLDTLAFQLSTGALVMLVVGGVRRLSGAVIGAVVYMVIQRVASAYNPHYWLFMIGFLLIVSMLALPNGLIAVIDRFVPASRRR
jgi:branched-chain amino acid transport system permease protein